MPVRSNRENAAFVLGGNSTTIAYASAIIADEDRVVAHMHGLAETPIGIVISDARQNVTLSVSGLLDWLDANFPPEDERSFVTPLRDIELLARVNWRVEAPLRLTDEAVLNLEDMPEDVADALAHPPEILIQCSACRRMCVRDHFVWKDRQLCAWDYHRQVFGKRGPWRNEPIEARHFETIPSAAYIAPPLLEQEGVDIVLAVAQVEDALAQQTVNGIIAGDSQRSYMAVRTPDGYSLVRER